ncbi:MAG TPA: 4-hydroxy-tetrahydrodipicolinate synthase [Bacteroidales bacterium]|nr:4-hydroxy-tetrahydrodipicolinate synthase [Bacteroidales bacterium]
MKKFRGIGVAIVTPFKNDTSIDFAALGKIIDHVINGGVNYIVLLGTTGEAATLSKDEKSALTSYVTEAVDKRVPVVLGIGGYSTNEVIGCIRKTNFEGIDAILSVVPYYNKPGQKGLYQHFRQISTSSPVPVILYNVPSRTSCNLLPETCLELAHDCENIIGIKEASGSMEQIMKILKDKPENFLVISGNDLDAMPVIASGGSGLISVLANAYPADWSEMVNQSLKSNFKVARELHYKYLEMIDLLFTDGSPSGVKAIMNNMGLCQNILRLPLVPVNRSVAARIAKAMEQIK